MEVAVGVGLLGPPRRWMRSRTWQCLPRFSKHAQPSVVVEPRRDPTGVSAVKPRQAFTRQFEKANNATHRHEFLRHRPQPSYLG